MGPLISQRNNAQVEADMAAAVAGASMGPLISQRNNSYRTVAQCGAAPGFNGAADFSAEQRHRRRRCHSCQSCFNGAADFSAEQLLDVLVVGAAFGASMGPLISQRNNARDHRATCRGGLASMGPLISQRNNPLSSFRFPPRPWCFNGAADFSAEQRRPRRVRSRCPRRFNGAADFSAEQLLRFARRQ